MAGESTVDVPLASAIEALRAELVAAVQAGQGQEVRFALGPIELELQVEVSVEKGLDAGVKFWVIGLGGEGTRSSGSTHTVRLSLSPVPASEAGDDRPLVVGSEVAHRPQLAMREGFVPERVVEVWAPAEESGTVGSGYLLGGGLVLTAGHVVDRAPAGRYEVRPLGTRAWRVAEPGCGAESTATPLCCGSLTTMPAAMVSPLGGSDAWAAAGM